VIPIADPYVAASTALAATLDAHRIRVDVDDRPGTVSRKIRDAEQEWIPYIICVGEREVGAEQLPVRVRATRTVTAMPLQHLIDQVGAETAGKPFARLSLPRRLSRRPRFYG
jgi:threonyl-tRNA synthetase